MSFYTYLKSLNTSFKADFITTYFADKNENKWKAKLTFQNSAIIK